MLHIQIFEEFMKYSSQNDHHQKIIQIFEEFMKYSSHNKHRHRFLSELRFHRRGMAFVAGDARRYKRHSTARGVTARGWLFPLFG
jgi:hypothetical protein